MEARTQVALKVEKNGIFLMFLNYFLLTFCLRLGYSGLFWRILKQKGLPSLSGGGQVDGLPPASSNSEGDWLARFPCDVFGTAAGAGTRR